MKTRYATFTTILLLLFNYCFGQDGKNSFAFEDGVRKEIENTSSAFYYANLINKINKEPDKITREEIKYLYYGQIYKKGTGLGFLDDPEGNEFRKAVSKNKCDKVLKLGYFVLHKNPVELTTLFPVNSCREKNDEPDSLFLVLRTKMVMEVILETGDGKTRETAIKIANIEDDLVLKGILGFKGGKETLESTGGRTYSVWTNGDKKIYFEDCWNYKYR
ncbi:DUF4919 domain-containing protein [Mucilaginibacter calamicampi]|uniref:DUF4919 domain-containing protein n=1 Tax=Mucilaginibacter calamicampi TaxID=1302352 RepID=A0ABW2YWF1_9SPHI